MIALRCQVSGAVSSFSISPALPEGLALDAATGALHGACGAPGAAHHVVTAHGDEGTTTAAVAFVVALRKPSGLGYPMASPSYAVAEEIEIRPEIEGLGTQ